MCIRESGITHPAVQISLPLRKFNWVTKGVCQPGRGIYNRQGGLTVCTVQFLYEISQWWRVWFTSGGQQETRLLQPHSTVLIQRSTCSFQLIIL